MDNKDMHDAVDPAAYALMEHIRKSRVDLSALPVWEIQVSAGYVLPAKAHSVGPESSPDRVEAPPIAR